MTRKLGPRPSIYTRNRAQTILDPRGNPISTTTWGARERRADEGGRFLQQASGVFVRMSVADYEADPSRFHGPGAWEPCPPDQVPGAISDPDVIADLRVPFADGTYPAVVFAGYYWRFVEVPATRELAHGDE